MEETKEKLLLNTSSGTREISNNPTISRGFVSPYHQQANDINNMLLQNQMIRELYTQLNLLEERSALCIKVKDNAIEDATRKCGEMEICLRKSLAETEYWKKLSHQKNALCRDLAGRLLEVRRKEISMKKSEEKRFEEEAQSSTGENGDDDVVDTARTRSCKRRRL